MKEYVECTNLSVYYNLDDGSDTRVNTFVVDSKESNEIVYSVIRLMDTYHLANWGVNLSSRYKNIKANCIDAQAIKEYLVTDMDRLKDLNKSKSLKLEK